MWWRPGTAKTKGYQAEFFRGPYDGLEVVCGELAKAIVMPVSANLLRRMTGDLTGEPSPVSSLALYRLRKKDSRNRYEYFGSLSASRVHLEKWVL
jgi:hypothetical protein